MRSPRSPVLGLLLPAFALACSSGEGSVQYGDPDELLRDLGELGGANGHSGSGAPLEGEAHVIPEPGEVLSECAEDSCPQPGGLTWRCRSRFAYGNNLAWSAFSGDFGGIERWEIKSVSQDPVHFSKLFAEMKSHGVNLVRWWMFPDFRGDGVLFDEFNKPIGVNSTVLEDLSTALELAQAHDLYLMLTLFSFDGFKPVDGTDLNEPTYMTPLVLDDALRSALIENVVRPIAKEVDAHEHYQRLHSWDLINEPEWAMQGPSLYDRSPYSASGGTDPVTHGEMEQFLAEINVVLRQESRALISVGSSLKWPKAWSGLDTDFHQMHYYPWMEPLFPVDRTPAELGLDDKPVVLGEFPAIARHSGGSLYSYPELMNVLLKNGWAGALGWDWSGSSASEKAAVKDFADGHSCETAY